MTENTVFSLIDMEIASADDDSDSTILIDSGTESFESPVGEDDSKTGTPTCQLEQTIIWDLGPDKKQRTIKNILDKSISVDEDSLIKPLEPIICNVHTNNINNNNRIANNGLLQPLMSILRRTSCYDDVLREDIYMRRRVSFPDDLATLASYKEPDMRSPFNLSESMTSEEILIEYQQSCKKHQTIESDVIKNQISEIKNNSNHTASLNLGTMNITMEVCETLEDLFQIVNFRTINLKDCNFSLESIREFTNILDYYNSASEYIVGDHFKELEAWKSFCGMTSRSCSLESLSLEGFNFTDNYMKVLLNNIKTNESLNILKFISCKLGTPQTIKLVDELTTNTAIQELYLSQTGLYTKEADLLGRLLNTNLYLQVLDISNNMIGDRGLEALAKGLCTQTSEGCGLSVLVIFNNQITEKSGPIISNIIAECKNLHTLNLGYNNLTDDVIVKIEASLEITTLEGLGLQSTLLTDKGICILAEAIQKNSSLQKINLKGNKAIKEESLLKLSKALTNTKIIKVEIDESNRNCDNPQGFMEVVNQINAICTVNKNGLELDPEWNDAEVTKLSSVYFTRKVSLNCEPVYHVQQHILTEPVTKSRKKSPSPSPIPSPGCSPIPRSRFSVSRVPDTPKPKSRFKVIAVSPSILGSGDSLATSPPPDEDDEVRQFANVRSSVSSIESVDSISNRDSVYDSATPSGESD